MKFILIVLLLLIGGCAKPDNCGINSGTMVQSKLDGRVGMVIAVWEYIPQVQVRFPNALQITTDTHTLGPDGSVQLSPYSDVVMQCFEIDTKR